MSLRDSIVAHARWGVANESQIHYKQSRPIDGLDEVHKLPLFTDCSGFVTDCYKWAGAPDPNGQGYNGAGFTGTLLTHLPHIDVHDAIPGDLVVFGPGTGEHVVVIVEGGASPVVVSHGQEAGPLLISLAQEANAHKPPTIALRGIGLDPGVANASGLTAPPFPLAATDWFGLAGQDTHNHSGAASAEDRAAFIPWQQRMIDRGWNLVATGIFDVATNNACSQFQEEAMNEGFDTGGLDGQVGPKTWALAWTKPVT
jgi:hypothetical protein